LLFRIIFLLTNLCSICCLSKLENPTLVSTDGADIFGVRSEEVTFLYVVRRRSTWSWRAS